LSKSSAVTEPGEGGALRVAGNGRTSAPASPKERRLTRRRNLPGGRAVVGGFLVAVAAVLTFAAYTSATARPRQLYVVAARSLAPGTRLSAADLSMVALDLPDARVRGQVFGSTAPLIGASVVAPVAPGALLEATAVVGRAGPLGTREVSIEVDRSRAVAGTLKPGEYVDVLGTFGTGTGAYTAVLVAHVEVISISNVNGSLGDTRTQLITFAAATETDAEAIANANIAAHTTLIRSSEEPVGASPTASPYHPPGPNSTGGP
jgi:Flp pilus assembly protein CpaB